VSADVSIINFLENYLDVQTQPCIIIALHCRDQKLPYSSVLLKIISLQTMD